ncbi:serine/threonine-protein kinase [Ktedonospora formicarum]|uniref:Protein kinase domain-containing protein n=1 Tax=Ktedonospora formicarum TaxID=2778364 RepID=A0A8J3MTP3_9CHLR|nr:serine/threonine-protein kinase [Ktedonospora formicarum]GHO46136.1 hypothetical protein KSX_42990 [Ktedonospora formicarum]
MGEQVNHVGQRLGNYQLVRMLGKGGFAQVYLGEHIHLGTQAAIKVLHTRLSDSDIEAFRMEARTIARLVHPHIVRVLEFGVEGNTPFLVMEYAAEGTIRKQHSKGTILPLETITSYVQQISEALQYAHDQKVVHRDIKPENMLLDKQHRVLLSDFGIAVAVQSSQDPMARGIAGTATYMSPEQIKGKFSPASDQYALGIVVYEWLCGERPFQGSFTELCVQHLFASPPSLHEKVSEISPAIEKIVMRALAKEPAQRFQDIHTFAVALQEAYETRESRTVPTLQTAIPAPEPQEDHSLAAVADTPPTELKAAKSSTQLKQEIPSVSTSHEMVQPAKGISRRTVILASLGGLVGVGGGVTWLVASYHKQPSTPVFATPFAPTTSSSSSSTLPSIGTTLSIYEGHTDTVDAITWSPDGKYIASGGNDRTVQIWDAEKGVHISTYREHKDGVHGVAWSPDGKRIASGGYDKTVRIWDVANGGKAFTYVYTGHGNLVEEVGWSPDGKKIAVTGVRTMETWNAEDGGQRTIYQQGLGAAKTVSWFPKDGHQIASGGGIMVYIWNVADGKQAFAYTGHTDRVDTVAWSLDGKRIASSGKDKTVQVWDSADGSHVVTYRGHADYINSLAWSPDGKRIASGGNDEAVHVWDATDGRLILKYRGHTSDVNAVAWSPDGKRIASGDDGKSVRVWVAP